MGLAQLQTALARLYVDESFRRKLCETGEELDGLTPAERDQLIKLAKKDSRLSRFSESLIAKRRGEVAKLLPATTKLLGQEFRSSFRDYAGATQLGGLNKHALDAIAYARGIARNPTLSNRSWIQEIARFEADRLAASLNQPHTLARFYRYPVHRLAMNPTDWACATPHAKSTFFLWYRLPASSEMRCRIFSFPRGD